ncbi:ATP-grasp domain-containing protein [Sphaerisporangium album]|uniref:ATP-grasp domain-containing protein n=1 Tax=Sphaerisporangium album TaxID=509200 RepID=UPI0015F0A937|nr:ATP-grasp domain-containing protein [Sphaerisporangium album]
MSIVVVYDQGAVSPTEILQGFTEPQALILVLAGSAHAQRVRPLFAETCAAVHDLEDVDLVERLRGHGVTGVVTFSEPMLQATSVLASALGLRFHDAGLVERLTNKHVQRRRLRAAGVDETGSIVISRADEWDSAVERVRLPVVIKPARGVSSRNTVLIDELEAGRSHIGPILREEGTVVVEKYLRGIDVPEPFGDYVSVETVVQNGERCHLAITGKLRLVPPFRECGQFWPPRLDTAARESVEVLADQAIKALGVESGILHTEIKLTPDGPRIIEVNGRVGGYIPELARRAAAIDLIDVAGRIARGERVEIHPVDLDRVYFQFTTPAPTESGTVSAVCGADALKDVPGVVHRYPLVRPGTEVGGVWTHDLDLVVGDVPDHEALAATIETIMSRISYQFEIDGRRVDRSARDLVYSTAR